MKCKFGLLVLAIVTLVVSCSQPTLTNSESNDPASFGRALVTSEIDTTKKYKIRNAMKNNPLDVQSRGADLAQVLVYQNYTTQTQVWEFVASNEPGYYFIKNLNGTYESRLDALQNGVIGAGLVTYHPVEGDTQKWRLVDKGNGYYKIYNKMQNAVLDCFGYGEVGYPAVLYNDYASSTQLWKLEVYNTSSQ